MIDEYKINNVEYAKETTTASRESLSENLERDEDGQVVLKDNSKIPEFLFGACLPLDTAMNLIFDRLGKIVAQIENATLSDALGQSMLLGCADAAEMDSLSTSNQHVTSFSIVPVSRFLIERCAFSPSSIKIYYLTTNYNRRNCWIT